MSPVKRASSVTGLRKGVAVPGEPAEVAPSAPVKVVPERVAPVRVTLNFPPDLFRQLDHWTRDAADATGLPRVGVQDAVRAMVQVITSGSAKNAESQVLAALRKVRG